MASTTIQTEVHNPGGRKKNVARKLSLKQKAHFGSARVRAAAKKSLARKRNPNALSKTHRPRTKKTPVAAARKAAVSPKRKRPAGSVKRNRKRSRQNPAEILALVNSAGRSRQNPAEILALVNSAGRRKTEVAKTKKRQNSQRSGSAGKTKKNKGRQSRQSVVRNPGAFGRPSDWLALGGGAIVGGLGSAQLPQMVLGASNTGGVGYLAMAASTGILATLAHMMFKGRTMLTAGVIAGGAGALIKRVLGDYTPLGQYLGTSGVGDYLSNWNFTTPQIVGGPGNTQLGTAGQIPVSVAGAPMGAGRALMNV